MPKFRKKPVEIEAVQWTGSNAVEIKKFVGKREDTGECKFLARGEISGSADRTVVWDELHQTWVGVNQFDWIIKGIKGEFYPCESEVFDDTYEWAV